MIDLCVCAIMLKHWSYFPSLSVSLCLQLSLPLTNAHLYTLTYIHMHYIMDVL